jgi:hypothetical protein
MNIMAAQTVPPMTETPEGNDTEHGEGARFCGLPLTENPGQE